MISQCKIRDTSINRVYENGEEQSFKYVGIFLDEKLTFEYHIQNIEKKFPER